MPSHEDPLLTSARRESIVTLCIWAIAMTYTVGVCVTWGYGRDPASLTFVWGFPDWVFWGIVVPWVASTGVSAIFAMGVMQDAPLSDEDESTA